MIAFYPGTGSLRLLGLLGALLLYPAGAQSPVQPAEAPLERLADPARDDWGSEVFHVRIGPSLRRLASWLESCGPSGPEPEELFTKDVRIARLVPRQNRTDELVGKIMVTTAGAAAPGVETSEAPLEPLREWAASFGRDSSLRVIFKVVAVQQPSQGATDWTTEVRVESLATSGTRRVEETATWRVAWRPAAEGMADPRIRRIERLDVERVGLPAPLYREATGSLLGVTDETLALGGEYWYGRVDALGEPNLMGHQGLAVGDVDGNGLEDLYVALGTGLPNKLLLQQPDGSVRDVAAEAGVAWLDDTKGVLFADMDNDGDQDLLCAIGPTIVLGWNEGGARFRRFVSMRAPTPAAFYSLSVADYDLDGDLDIYGTRYVKVAYGLSVPLPLHDAENGPTNHLLRNEGQGRFSDATIGSGLDANNTRFSLAASWVDYDLDGDPDLYVSNDFGRNNLYRNDDGRFVDVAAESGTEDQAAGMGVAWADYDLDGDFDLHVTNMFSAAGKRVAYQPRFRAAAPGDDRRQVQRYSLGNTLLANRGDGTFDDVSDAARIRMGRWGWGGKFVDMNNDGLEDLVLPNGFLTGAVEDDL